MKRYNLRHIYMNEAPADGADSGAGAPPADNTPPAPAPVDFLSSLDAEYRESLEKQGIKDVNTLVKNWADQRSYIGNSIRVPSAEAGQEDWDKFYNKLQKQAPNLIPRPDKDKPETIQAVLAALGRPESPDGYEQPQVPEGVDFGEERAAAFKQIAHKHGLTKEQFQGVLSEVLQMDAATYQQQAQNVEADKAALKAEWGSAYDERKGQVVKLMELTGAPDGIIEMAKNGAMGADVYKWFHSLSGNFKGEGTQVTTDQGGNGALTPAEANERINEIYANRQHPFFNVSHPDHKNALKRMVDLVAAANPGASKDPNSLRTSRDAKFGG